MESDSQSAVALARALRGESDPSPQDWYWLTNVGRNLALIIEDDPVNQLLGSGSGGLLGGFYAAGDVCANDAPQRPALSRLGAIVARGFGPFDRPAQELCECLPGIENLGHDPQTRLDALVALCRKHLAAFKWLHRQEPWRKALAIMSGGAIGAQYARKDAELRLIGAIGWRLTEAQVYLYANPRYPSKEELKRALDAAAVVSSLYDSNVALRPDQPSSYANVVAARAIVGELQQAYERFTRKPQDDRTALKQAVLDNFIRETAKEFGTASATLLQQLALLIRYNIDLGNVRSRLRALGLSSPPVRREPEAAAVANESPEVGWAGFRGLGARG